MESSVDGLTPTYTLVSIMGLGLTLVLMIVKKVWDVSADIKKEREQIDKEIDAAKDARDLIKLFNRLRYR